MLVRQLSAVVAPGQKFFSQRRTDSSTAPLIPAAGTLPLHVERGKDHALCSSPGPKGTLPVWVLSPWIDLEWPSTDAFAKSPWERNPSGLGRGEVPPLHICEKYWYCLTAGAEPHSSLSEPREMLMSLQEEQWPSAHIQGALGTEECAFWILGSFVPRSTLLECCSHSFPKNCLPWGSDYL